MTTTTLFAVVLSAGRAVAGSPAARTIVVGSSPGADAATIQAGVDLVPDGAALQWTVVIEPGLYSERVHLERSKGPLALRGLGPPEAVVLTHACPGGAGNGSPGCSPCPPFNTSRGPTPGMRADVATLVAFSDQVTVSNLTVANSACGFDAKRAEQSDALQALGDRQLYTHCRILGGQDTLLTGPGSTRQYFYETFINGSCDSIYGGSSAVFDRCTITVTDHVTAQKPPDTGGAEYLVVDSWLRKPGSGEFDRPTRKGGTELGRPWGSHASVVYKNVWMDDHIAAYGWGDWGHGCSARPGGGSHCGGDPQCWCQNVTYAEYNSTGPGAAPASRVKWSSQLSAAEAARVTPASVLRGWAPALW